MNNIFLFFILAFSFELFPSAEVGIVSSAKGKVFVVRSEKKIPLLEGSSIHKGDAVETEEGASVTILYDDNSMQTVSSNSKVLIDSVSDVNEGSSYFTLMFGTLKSVVGKRKDKQKYEIEAGDVSLGVRGTALQVSLNGGRYELVVFEGKVEVRPVVVATSAEDSDTDTDTAGTNGSKTGGGSGSGTSSTKKVKVKGAISVAAGEQVGSGASVKALSPKALLKIVEEVAQAGADAVVASNGAQGNSSTNDVVSVSQTIEAEVVAATVETDGVKVSSAATESTEDLLDKGRTLLINLQPTVRSLVNELKDIQ